jgi:hypothetical protein
MINTTNPSGKTGEAHTGVAWFRRTFDAVTSGYFSLNDASQLTGKACGFTVAPDVSVFFNAAE